MFAKSDHHIVATCVQNSSKKCGEDGEVHVAVTGGAGFIGSHLVDRLLGLGYFVRAIDDLSAGSLENIQEASKNPNFHFFKSSVHCLDDMYDLTEGCEVIYHLATPCLVKGLEDPELMHKTTDVGTFNICLAARRHSAKLVYVSTSEVYGIQTTFPIMEYFRVNPVSLYGLAKHIGEMYVRTFNRLYDVPAVVIRPFNTYGERHREDSYACVVTNFIDRALKKLPPLVQGDGFQKRDFTHVSDIADGIILIGSRVYDGDVVNLGSGTEISMLDLAKTVYRLCGYEDFPGVEWLPPRPHDIRRFFPDIRKAKSYGYKVKTDLEKGLSQYIDWFKKNKGV